MQMIKKYCYYTKRYVVVSWYNAEGQCPCFTCTKGSDCCNEEDCRILREQHCIVPLATKFVGLDGKVTTFGVPLEKPLKGHKKDISYVCLNCLAVKEK